MTCLEVSRFRQVRAFGNSKCSAQNSCYVTVAYSGALCMDPIYKPLTVIPCFQVFRVPRSPPGRCHVVGGDTWLSGHLAPNQCPNPISPCWAG